MDTYKESTETREVKKLILDRIKDELLKKANDLGAFALKGGYVLTKYVVNNENIRRTSDIDMSVESLKVFNEIIDVILPIAEDLKKEGLIFDYRVKTPYVDENHNKSGGIKFRRKVNPNTKAFSFCGIDISIHSMEYGVIHPVGDVPRFTNERSIADKVSVLFNRDLYTICRRCRDLYDIYLYSSLNTVFSSDIMNTCLEKRGVNILSKSNFEKFIEVEDSRNKILEEVETLLTNGQRVDVSFVKKTGLTSSKIIKEVLQAIAILRRAYVNK